jgi:integrase
MARTVRDHNLSNRTQRGKLAARGKPYWRTMQQGLHIGYRKNRDGGRWVARIYAGDGQYRTETIGTADDTLDADGTSVLSFSQAQEHARRLHAEHHATDNSARPYTVAKALDAYITRLEAEGRPSLREAKSHATAIRPEFDDTEVSKLTAHGLRDWLNGLATSPRRVRVKKDAEPRYLPAPKTDDEKRARRATANRIWTTFRAALNQAFAEGKVASAATWQRVKPFRGADAARVRFLTVDESKRLMNACPSGFRQLVTAALATGARYGELCRLECGDYNPDAGTVIIRQSKSAKPRHVYLSDEGRAFFDRLTAGREAAAHALLKADSRAWQPYDQARPMRAVITAAKIDPPISFHGLRHTYSSLAVMNGSPLNVVAHNLGHSSTRMVERHYGHLAPSYIAETTRRTVATFDLESDGKVQKLRRRNSA